MKSSDSVYIPTAVKQLCIAGELHLDKPHAELLYTAILEQAL